MFTGENTPYSNHKDGNAQKRRNQEEHYKRKDENRYQHRYHLQCHEGLRHQSASAIYLLKKFTCRHLPEAVDSRSALRLCSEAGLEEAARILMRCRCSG